MHVNRFGEKPYKISPTCLYFPEVSLLKSLSSFPGHLLLDYGGICTTVMSLSTLETWASTLNGPIPNDFYFDSMRDRICPLGMDLVEVPVPLWE